MLGLNNVKIKTKLMISFSLVILCAAIITIFSIRSMNYINKEYINVINNAIEKLLEGQVSMTQDHIHNLSYTEIEGINDELRLTIQNLSSLSNQIYSGGDSTIIIIIVLGLILAIICTIFILLNINKIAQGTNNILNTSKRIASGDFDIKAGDDYKNEIAQVSNSLYELKVMMNKLTSDLSQALNDFKAGDIDVRLDESLYVGEFKLVVKHINSLLEDSVDDTIYMVKSVSQFGKGNFDIPIGKFPGKKEMINQSISSLQTNFNQFNTVISEMIKEASKGNLKLHIKEEKYNGDWNILASQINTLSSTLVEPVIEIKTVLNEMSKGNLNVLVKEDYKGDYLDIKESINHTINTLADYIKEIN